MGFYSRRSGFYSERVFPWIMDHLETERLAALREQALVHARGDVLELGFGTGHNIGHYPTAARTVTAVEPSSGMARRARRRTASPDMPIRLVRGDAQRLSFADRSFDTVVAILVLCTIPDAARALVESRRVLRPDGTLLFFEHVGSSDPQIRRWQGRFEPLWRPVACGCHITRETARSITGAGFRIEEIEHISLPGAPAIARSAILGHATPARG